MPFDQKVYSVPSLKLYRGVPPNCLMASRSVLEPTARQDPITLSLEVSNHTNVKSSGAFFPFVPANGGYLSLQLPGCLVRLCVTRSKMGIRVPSHGAKTSLKSSLHLNRRIANGHIAAARRKPIALLWNHSPGVVILCKRLRRKPKNGNPIRPLLLGHSISLGHLFVSRGL